MCCPLPAPTEFDQQWIEANQKHLEKNIVPTRDPRWGKLLLTWNQKLDEKRILIHKYTAIVDLQEGNLFLDCSTTKIYRKTFAFLLAVPFYIFAKTVIHISQALVLNDISNSVFFKQPFSTTLKNAFKNLADIIRTPLFGIILIISSISILCLGLFKPESMYTYRDFLGKILLAMNWGERSKFELAECFIPAHLSRLENFSDNTVKDTVYPSHNKLEKQFTLFARAVIIHQLRNYDYYLCKKYKPTSPYISQ